MFRAVGGGELRVAFVTWVEVAGGARCRITEIVDDEQIGGESATAVVALAALGVNADLHAYAAVGSLARRRIRR